MLYILEGSVEVLLKLPGAAPAQRASRRRASANPDDADLIGDDLPPSLLEACSGLGLGFLCVRFTDNADRIGDCRPSLLEACAGVGSGFAVLTHQ